MLDPTAATIATILDQLRKLLNLSEGASLQDISTALLAIDDPMALQALSATFSEDREPSVAEKITRLLGVTPEMLRKWG